MQVNKFIPMAVGLIVGVLLISGVVAPVIANVSSSGGSGENESGETFTNTAPFDERYSRAENGKSVTLYAVGEGQYDGEYTVSTEPDNVGDRPIYTISNSLNLVRSIEGELGIWEIGIGKLPSNVIVFGRSASESYSAIIFENHTLIGVSYPSGDEEVIYDDIVWYGNPAGDYVQVISYGLEGNGFANTSYAYPSTVFFACFEIYDDVEYYVFFEGSALENRVYITNYPGPGEEIPTFDETAKVDIVNNQVASIRVTINDIEYTVPTNGDYDADMIAWSDLILPETVTPASDSGGSSLSPTLATVLSVIPLVLTVGLVLGAVTYLRMKN